MILAWLQRHFPGRIEEGPRYTRMWHDCGDVTTLWVRAHESTAVPCPNSLNGFYDHFDAADILSSTFKISSPSREIIEGSVPLVYSRAQLKEIVAAEQVLFQPEAVPFMMQSGIWIYAYAEEGQRILEWDLELKEPGDSFFDLISVLEEWRSAVHAK